MNIKDVLISAFVFIIIPIATICICVFIVKGQPIRNTCIVGSRWYGNCSIDGEYEGTKKITCFASNGKFARAYTFYTTGDCYPNTNTGKIQLYNEHGIKR